MREWNRHDYILVNRAGRLYAYGNVSEQLSGSMRAHLEEVLMERTGKMPVPAIFCRQSDPCAGFLQVGWSSWERRDDIRLRFRAEIPKNSIEQVITPYEVFSMENEWPEVWKKLLADCKKLAEEYGISLGVFGGAGLQILTGKPYIHPASDLDLILTYKENVDLSAFLAACQSLSAKYQTPLDLELQFPGFGGVKLKEWVSDQKTVLVKGNDFADIVTREACIAHGKASEEM